MTKNLILEAIRETRERLLAESGGTLDGLVKRLQAEEEAAGRRTRDVVSPEEDSRGTNSPQADTGNTKSSHS